MCGIVGIVGNENAASILVDGLEKLEYRGYDSAGIFVADQSEDFLVKSQGRIKEMFMEQSESVIHVGPLMENQVKKMLIHILHKVNVLF